MMLSEQIKRGRNALGMSQADLAEAIWVSRNTVCNWETGAMTPDIQSLVLMSALFGVSVDEMVKGDDKAQHAPGGGLPSMMLRTYDHVGGSGATTGSGLGGPRAPGATSCLPAP